ncbi:hypothetical protein SAMN04488029_3805 [Reichenbachiella faecimaris]|uniref:Uncharacterized protein n=1 Tax=Reichenbachiella faecimaris TaxID=692418 RepID=A0A1W2GPF9_REIFA|nr:hypothetical protein [Reichenbachiella faecimaris]SMD38560.1 hypothetical protein SAMN04488029_3805 [Reichenbachiella faecimaris]
MQLYKILGVIVISAIIMSCDDSSDSKEMEDEIDDLILAEGNYRGSWTSETESASFNGLAISARITKTSNNSFSGEFFISSNYTSCCGSGDNDGTIVFKVAEEKINDFAWYDIIPSCNGLFEGAGEITSYNKFRIEFTGSDCDGDHVGWLTLSHI